MGLDQRMILPAFGSLGFGVSGESFTFQTTSAANNVPDGGMTVLLLGAALSGLALIRRKLA